MKKKVLSIASAIAIFASAFSIHPGVSKADAPTSQATSSIFGPNVYVFDPTMASADIQAAANAVYADQEEAEFGSDRYALLFKPGSYSDLNVKVGFYTQVSGLGQNPDDVTINGNLGADAKWADGNATRNFWRSIENLAINPLDLTKSPPTAADAQWAVSQAAPMRRVHIKGNLLLFDFDPYWNAGWASGGYIADSKVDKQIIPASQQQFFSRNNDYDSWSNAVWNMVHVGDVKPPVGSFPDQAYTIVDKAPVMREKPYLYVKDNGDYAVFVPSLQTDASGVSWENRTTPGTSIGIDQFYIAKPDSSTAADINAALANGKNLIFTPGIYHLNDTIRVSRADTVVLGLGYATLTPETGKPALQVADVDGVSVSGLLFEAGAAKSPTLMEVGAPGSTADHASDPTLLSDLYFAVGGMAAGTADVGLAINSKDVIGDHFWIWRADHGAGAGWNTNVSKNGLVVNGDDVTIYGLFNEHHEEYQTLWNGNGGRLYFYQSEIPYDPQTQQSWMSHNGTVNGYASYKVADNVTTHEAWGLGIYSYFRDAAIKLENAIEVPQVPGVAIHHMTTVWLNGQPGSEITHVINGTGGRVYTNSPESAMRQTVSDYAGGDDQAPSVPTGLTATAVSSSQIDLAWNASTDNVGVDSYDIYRDGKKIGTTHGTTFSSGGLKGSRTYSFTVAARDSAGNVSATSESASATTEQEFTPLDMTGWTAEAPIQSADAGKMVDGNTDTKWTTGKPMDSADPDQYLIVDMQREQRLSRIVLVSNGDYARGYSVYLSDDKTDWGEAVASGTGANPNTVIDFTAQSARYIKVVQTASAPQWWAVNEFKAYTDTETALDRSDWTIATNPSGDTPANLIDGNPSTRWTSNAMMEPGQFIQIDMKNEMSFNKIAIDSTGSANDYSRNYAVYATNDLQSWGDPILSATASGPLVLRDLGEQHARYVKIVQNGNTQSWWSVHEINLYRDASAPVLVTGIAVTGENGANAITAKGGMLQMHVQALPAYADETSVTWAVYNADHTPTDIAAINADGLLTAVDNGTVLVEAAATDGSGVKGTATVVISGQHPVESIAVTGAGGADAITEEGGTLQMSAAVLPDNADDASVTWTVARQDGTATDAATISASGLLTAVKNGTVKVVATANDGSGVTGSAIIAISGQQKVTSIAVTGADDATSIATKGGTLQMSAEVLPQDAADASVTWTVVQQDGTATDAATISADGLLTAVKNGTVKVVATANDGSGVTGSAIIAISGQQDGNEGPGDPDGTKVTSIAVTGADGATSIATKGGTLQMSAEVLPQDAADASVTWTVVQQDGTATDAATVSEDGLLTAVKNGTVKVVATANDGSGVTGSAIIAISGQQDGNEGPGDPDGTKVTSIAVTGADGATSIATKGGTLQMSAEVLPQDAADASVTWTVVRQDGTATDAATISASGLLTAVKNGTVKVVATANDGSGVTGSATIAISGQTTVTPPSNPTTATPPATTDSGVKVEGDKAVVELKDGASEATIAASDVQAIGDHPLEIRSADATVTIPADILKQLIGQLPDAKDATVKIVVKSEPAADRTTNDPSLKMGDRVYTFELSAVDKDGKAFKPGLFSVPVQVTLPYGDSGLDASLLGIYVLDATTNEWQYVGGHADPAAKTIAVGVSHFSQYAVMAYDKSFTDVPATHWAYAALKTLAAKHIVTGQTADAFNPSGTTTRAEFVTMLVKALGLTAGDGATAFADVRSTDWYAESVAAAVKAGLVTGLTATEFAPNAPMTREQMATLIVRAYEYAKGAQTSSGTALDAAKDRAQVSVWAVPSVNKAIELGLMKGQSQDVFAPQSNAVRAETAQAILNLLNKLGL